MRNPNPSPWGCNGTGSTFRAFYSTNGSSWTQFGNNRTISMGSSTYLGIATTSGGTMIMAGGGTEKPMLGRYQVEKELGRLLGPTTLGSTVDLSL